MLVLSRKKNQTIRIGEDVFVKIIEVKGGVVRIGIDAPDEIPILRSELISTDEVPARIRVPANEHEPDEVTLPALPRLPR